MRQLKKMILGLFILATLILFLLPLDSVKAEIYGVEEDASWGGHYGLDKKDTIMTERRGGRRCNVYIKFVGVPDSSEMAQLFVPVSIDGFVRPHHLPKRKPGPVTFAVNRILEDWSETDSVSPKIPSRMDRSWFGFKKGGKKNLPWTLSQVRYGIVIRSLRKGTYAVYSSKESDEGSGFYLKAQ